MDDSFLDHMNSKDLDATDRTIKEALIRSQQTMSYTSVFLMSSMIQNWLVQSLAKLMVELMDQGKQTDDNVYSAIRQLTSSIVAECGNRIEQ
ncbi:unnamed protein product [Didymodactylos carnosus]|uniref:Uncharacterized protein n=1 Tax=Didymodactylos carnosus TaxID=1234261 RepID=A0A816D8E6_9BILA|nr:unnamed protein product [Didymodactylos carnosus]CAF4531121.1 unnamed protein product [Didymodactylos carnosus]